MVILLMTISHHSFTWSISLRVHRLHVGGFIFIYVLQIRIQTFREIRLSADRHLVQKWRNWKMNPGPRVVVSHRCSGSLLGRCHGECVLSARAVLLLCIKSALETVGGFSLRRGG